MMGPLEAGIYALVVGFIAGYIFHGWEFDGKLNKLTKLYETMMNALVVDGEWIPCGWCKEPVLTHWVQNGGLLPGDYVLVANWVFHLACWQQIENKLDET